MALTKVPFSMVKGAPANVLDYGADPTGVADSTAAIQAALDASKAIFLPVGTYKITSTLLMNDGNFIFGSGLDSVISSTYNGPAIRGKGVTPSSGTNVRRYNGGGSNFSLVGPTLSASSSTGLDMRGCTLFVWTNIRINKFHTGVVQGDGYSTYYNDYYSVTITEVYVGYYNDALANENKVFGGKVGSCTWGTRDGDNSHNVYYGLAIEVFTIGHLLVAPATQQIQFMNSRLENAPSTGTGFSIDATSQDTQIICPLMAGLATDITDNGVRTNIIASEYWKISGGTRIFSRVSQDVTIDFPSIPANSTYDTAVAITGVLQTDSSFITPNVSFNSGLIVTCKADTGGVLVRVANVTTSAIDPASQTFRIDVWQNS